MRIDRVRLKNFGGVTEAEVRFAAIGVTIVHGPNEAGKSTLMQGINVLFDHRDDSRKEEVRKTKPVHRDVGSEVEADIEMGAYQFTYFKRFHKDRETRLTIHAPKAENLSGREAHDRVQQILAGSVDTALWRALRIAQGQQLDMPELNNQPALAQALDRAAGQTKSGEKEEALFEAARNEFARYFTETGREKDDPIGQARARAAEALARVQSLQSQLKEIEDDIGRFASLEKSVATHRRGLSALEDARKKAQADWDEVSMLAVDIDRAHAQHQLSAQGAQAIQAAREHRVGLVRRVKQAAEAARQAAALHTSSSGTYARATEQLNAARATREAAQTVADQRDADEALREADLKFRDAEFALVLMKERLAHVREADTEAARANAVVASTKITEKLRSSIREAELALKTAQGVLNVASPQLTITAMSALSLDINGVPQALVAGQARVITVSELVCATLANVADFRVEPGTSAHALRQAVTDAQHLLTKACAKAGVATPEDAEHAWTALQDSKRTTADRDRVARQHLRDLTRESLERLVQTTTATVAAYPSQRSSAHSGQRSSALPLPASVDQAKELLGAASQAAVLARRAFQDAESAFRPLQIHFAECAQDSAVKTALLEQAAKDERLETERLEGERHTCGDEELNNRLAFAQTAVAAALENLRTAKERLGNRDPLSIKAILDSAEPALKNAREQSDRQEQHLIALRARLELIGDKGLAQALSEAERVAFEASDALERLLRRADAAKLLFNLLSAEQQAMRKAYVRPLREGIERLGRHVFGSTLRVDVNDQLQVASRTIGDVTVSLEQLSTGAREQMGLLVRLAAASMVSKDGGVPLVLDDALGSTDDSRIEAMGAVLRIASQNLQTIILTCSPERYVHVGARVSVKMD